jgi:hypothetical protein
MIVWSWLRGLDWLKLATWCLRTLTEASSN